VYGRSRKEGDRRLPLRRHRRHRRKEARTGREGEDRPGEGIVPVGDPVLHPHAYKPQHHPLLGARLCKVTQSREPLPGGQKGQGAGTGHGRGDDSFPRAPQERTPGHVPSRPPERGTTAGYRARKAQRELLRPYTGYSSCTGYRGAILRIPTGAGSRRSFPTTSGSRTACTDRRSSTRGR